jgi:hypothetical protein
MILGYYTVTFTDDSGEVKAIANNVLAFDEKGAIANARKDQSIPATCKAKVVRIGDFAGKK